MDVHVIKCLYDVRKIPPDERLSADQENDTHADLREVGRHRPDLLDVHLLNIRIAVDDAALFAGQIAAGRDVVLNVGRARLGEEAARQLQLLFW